MNNSRIAIDGPAGAGKSTIAKIVAKELGYTYIDTGAMYRAVALKALRMGISPFDDMRVNNMLSHTRVDVVLRGGEQAVMLDGEDVTGLIRAEEVSKGASDVAVNPAVRLKLVELQREMASKRSVVMDGRDIGSYVLPDAQYKFYITASVNERARRRYIQLERQNMLMGRTVEKIAEEIKARDATDKGRAFAPLVCLAEAVCIDTTQMSIIEAAKAVLDYIVKGGESR